MMSFLLAAVGSLLLLVWIFGVAFGLYMTLDPRTKEQGLFFALWWVPAAAAAAGVLMRDPVTFLIGALCFAVAGAALFGQQRARPAAKMRQRPEDPPRKTSERVPTKEPSKTSPAWRPWLSAAAGLLRSWRSKGR